MRFFPRYFLATALALLCCVQVDAQQRVRIAGLENNPEYRRLVGEEGKLARMSDSISESMNSIRRSFRTDTLNRAANSAAILRMESEMFDIRNRMARLAGQINSMEQEWIMQSLDSGDPADTIPAGEERTVANLVYNSYFDRSLGPDNVRELRAAQHAESDVPPLIEQYYENNDRLMMLKFAYDISIMAGTADSIRTRFDSLARVNAGVDRLIARTWSTVFDNKSYCYNLLMDKNNRTDLLEQFAGDMERLRQAQAEWQGVYASDIIVNYFLQKKLITDYEIKLAANLKNQPALDSLKRVQAALPHIDALDLPPVRLRERLFLDYEDIKIESSSPYNSKNPIPDVKIYPKGVIYRVLLGTYSSVQQPSVFKNVTPLSVDKGPDGKYRYFAGGFPADTTINAVVEQMKQRGFKSPQPVAWMDGVYINLETGKGLGSGFYRVELSGVQELTPEVREVIRTVTNGKTIVRGEGMFIVGPLDDGAEAARLRAALDRRDPEMEIKLSEIPN